MSQGQVKLFPGDDKKMPGGWGERSPEWHFDKIIDFTERKARVNEPSPHLRIMGYFCEGQPPPEKAWRLACYAATYCLPTGQVIWSHWPYEKALRGMRNGEFAKWLEKHWPGIVTRTERRCVRSWPKMNTCLTSSAEWIERGLEALRDPGGEESVEAYDAAWDSVLGIKYFGRYIAIRFIEGLRRYCDVPARLYDMRSIGGWSPKKALAYFYPGHVEILLHPGREGDTLADQLFEYLKNKFSEHGQQADYYVLAAMLCEYREAFEDRHQYPGWTIDQEPLLFDKVASYWGDDVATDQLWIARKKLFPPECLGEAQGWGGTRWELTKTLRDHGYNWSDIEYDYMETLKSERGFSEPAMRQEGKHG